MAAVVLNGLYASGRNFLVPMLFRLLSENGYAKCVYPVKAKEEGVDLLNLPPDLLMHDHFLLGDAAGYSQMLKQNYKHLFLYRDLRDALVSGMNYDRNCAITSGRPLNVILNQMSELDALKYILRNQHKPPKRGHSLLSLIGAVETARHCLKNPRVHCVTFERLKSDTKGELTRIMAHIGLNVDERLLAEAIEEGSFEKKTRGRVRGVENKSSLFRKGVSGDWKNHFDDEVKALFKELFGAFLIETGYEKDDNW